MQEGAQKQSALDLVIMEVLTRGKGRAVAEASVDTSFLADLSAHWLDGPVQSVTGLVPAGSPDRSASRLVAVDQTGRRFVLEGVRPDRAAARTRQATILLTLASHGVAPLLPWMTTRNGARGVLTGGLFWQLRSWQDSLELPRDEYGRQAWRGNALADFLVSLRHGSRKLPPPLLGNTFSTVAYVDRLLPLIAARHRALHTDLLPIWTQLADFRQAHATLPLAWCHGDLHPLNVLWAQDGLNAVIDWEFTGVKAEGYDLANLLGCLGVDNPEFLTGDMAQAVCTGLAKARLFAPQTWQWLPEYIVAQRFGWMREWCWRQNHDMICQELDFMWLLLDNRDFLRQRWRAWHDLSRTT